MQKQNLSLFLFLISLILILSSDSNIKLNSNYEDTISYIKDNHEIVNLNKIFLEIPKISFIRALDQNNSNVDKDLWVAKESVFPDFNPSNVIIAGHSGRGSNAYFQNLSKLVLNDIIRLYYKAKIYEYELFQIEEQPKTGTLDILNISKNLITLITCTKNDNYHQTIYYGVLKSVKNM